MKILQLNNCCTSSPGMLMGAISKCLTEHDIENKCLFTYGESRYPNSVKYGNDAGVKLDALASRLSGRYGFVSAGLTRKLIHIVEEFEPDLVQMHVIHGHDLNMNTFFHYLAKQNIPVVYTFHDTWAFTGYCSNYDEVKCEKWKTECHSCPVYHDYSWFFDRSFKNHADKINAIQGIPHIEIVTPSNWMKRQVEASRLNQLPVTVIPNGIDTNVFKPKQTNIKQQLGIETKKMVLAVAMELSESKGANDLIALSKLLPDSYQLVLVGVPEEKNKLFPDQIICCPKTGSRDRLAEFYSAADVFLNPTHGDNFPTVNLESLACGTPVVTYDVGGSPEMIDRETGIVVQPGNIEELCIAVGEADEMKNSSAAVCRKRAVELYDQKVFGERYYTLYQKVLSEN